MKIARRRHYNVPQNYTRIIILEFLPDAAAARQRNPVRHRLPIHLRLPKLRFRLLKLTVRGTTRWEEGMRVAMYATWKAVHHYVRFVNIFLEFLQLYYSAFFP